MALELMLNGKARAVDGVESDAPLAAVLQALGLRADRIAVERNGTIVPRSRWAEDVVRGGDKLEVVHFVGGGRGAPKIEAGLYKTPGDVDIRLMNTRRPETG